MKRTALLAALLVAIACTMALSTPRPLHAILCCDNCCATTQHWVMRPTCSEAQTAYRAEALPEAQADCGGATQVCAFSIPACYASGGQWVVDGTASFGCKYQCEIIP
jgi:hypothetical protein